PITDIYTLSLHDALPIYIGAVHNDQETSERRRNFGKRLMLLARSGESKQPKIGITIGLDRRFNLFLQSSQSLLQLGAVGRILLRSEEHTSELQSPCNLVC